MASRTRSGSVGAAAGGDPGLTGCLLGIAVEMAATVLLWRAHVGAARATAFSVAGGLLTYVAWNWARRRNTRA